MRIVRTLFVSALFGFVLLGFAASPAVAQTLTRGPLIQNPAALTTTMTILWWTNVSGNSTVEYGITPSLGSSVTVPTAGSCEVGAAGTCHTVPLTGLLPGTRYYYRLLTNATQVLATTYFQTFKIPSDTSELYFTVVGDWGQGSSAQGQVGNIQNADDPPLLMTVGDNAYQDGIQSDWDDNVFISQYKNGILRRAVFMPTLGNHDLNNVGAANWANSVEIKMHALPRNAPAGQEERFFSFDHGNAHFVVLDSNPPAINATQTNWLAADLAATTRKWKFVFFHHVSYSCANGFASIGSDHTVRATWGPILEQYGVDVVFVGHDHIYERSKVVDDFLVGGGSGSDGLGTIYVMSGGGGASLDSPAQVDGGGPFGQGFFHSKEYCPWLSNQCPNGVNGQYCSFARFQHTDVRITGDNTLTVKAIDNNDTIFDQFSITKGALCGNSLVEAGEQCDQGAANGASTSCCTASCSFVGVGTTCRAIAGPCDVVETCSGASATCPSNGFLSPANVCRPAAGGCDIAENCTGSSAACPANDLVPNGIPCRGSAGVCDLIETCTGTAACPTDAKSSAVCRPAADLCDAVESCNGVGNNCPADAPASAGTPCRGPIDVCDAAESCTGSSTECPPDGFASSATVCRGASGSCDIAENCTGGDPSCPADGYANSSTVCRAGVSACDATEHCTGGAPDCPADGFASSVTVCRASVSPCDATESCTGSSSTCPADGFAPSTTVCRAAVSPCDVAENCTGSSGNCPADAVASSATVCRAAVTVCDVAEQCDGTTTACPANAFAASAVTCRAAVGVCDVAENCTGSSSVCPANGFATNAVTCRSAVGVCDAVENCVGGANCPADAFLSSSVECRPTAGTCDVPEVCSGSASDCPVDSGQPDGDDDGVCDLEDVCVTVVDPGQEDADGDSLGDACDPCTNAGPVLAVKPRLSMQRLAVPPGDDRFKLQAVMTVPSAAIDPAVDGLRILIHDAGGQEIVDATIPPGVFNVGINAGWKVNSKRTSFLYKNLGGGVPLVEGVSKIVLKVSTKHPGEIRFTVQARNGTYPLPASLPLKATVILTPPYASTNQCGDAIFPGAPTGSCAFVAPPGTIKCK